MKALVTVSKIEGEKPKRYRVELVLGVQSFGINSEFKYTKAEALWLKQQLTTAMVSFGLELLERNK